MTYYTLHNRSRNNKLFEIILNNSFQKCIWYMICKWWKKIRKCSFNLLFEMLSFKEQYTKQNTIKRTPKKERVNRKQSSHCLSFCWVQSFISFFWRLQSSKTSMASATLGKLEDTKWYLYFFIRVMIYKKTIQNILFFKLATTSEYNYFVVHFF